MSPPVRTAGPRPPRAPLWRPRLAESLDTGVRRAVTVIRAGPGWGKTALAASWAGRRAATGPVAWLTCEQRHNEPAVLRSDLTLALRTAGADRPPAAAPRPGDAPAGRGPLTGLAGLPAVTVLILDDLQELTDPGVLAGLTELLEKPPENLRFVLISRAGPGVALHRLRAAGELTEIGAEDLAFRVDEAAQLLAAAGRQLPAAEVADRVRRAEGWAAGLRLELTDPAAGLPLELADPAAGAVEDYLVAEVLDAQQPAVRDFLLRTCVPDRICGELAEALTGRPFGERTLEQLAHANLFLERIGTGRWFRYHPMFRSALRHRLAVTEPERVPQLHLLAAQWHATSGSGLAAINHAAAGGDWAFVARLVVDRGLRIATSGDRVELLALLRRIPADRCGESAELAFCAALRAHAEGGAAAVPSHIARARKLLTGRDPGYREVIGLALDVLECGVVIRARGDMPGLVAVAARILDDLATLRWELVPARLQYRALMLGHKGAGLLWTGDLDHAERFLWAAASAARAAGVPLVEVSALANLSLLVFLQGAPGTAAEHATAAIDLARRIDAETRPAVAPGYLTRALIEAERGHEAAAHESLRCAQHAVGDDPEAVPAVMLSLVRARLLLDHGEPLAARSLLHRAPAEAGPHLAAPLLDRLLALGTAEADLALGEPAAVVARYTRGPAGPALLPAEQICLARAHLAGGGLAGGDRARADHARGDHARGDHARGNLGVGGLAGGDRARGDLGVGGLARGDRAGGDLAGGAEAAAEQLLARVREGSDRSAAVSAWILTALAADARGHGTRAGEALSRALDLAEPDLLRQPFRRFASPRLLVLAERQQWLGEARGPAHDGLLAEITGELPVIGAPAGAGPLSERELEVLRYLPTVLTAAEIAENLGISVNTVKAHMRSIYRKLGVGRRREAIMLSRQLGLL